MIVRMWMTRTVETVTPNTTLGDAAEAMRRGGLDRLVVAKERRAVGVLTRSDLLKSCPADVNPFSDDASPHVEALTVPVARAMTRDIVTVDPNAPIEHAARLLMEKKIGALPVILGERLVGVLSTKDILRAFQVMLFRKQAIRVTYVIPEEGDDAMTFLRTVCSQVGLQLSCYFEFDGEAGRLAVATAVGENAPTLVERLWDAGATVLNVLDSSAPEGV